MQGCLSGARRCDKRVAMAGAHALSLVELRIFGGGPKELGDSRRCFPPYVQVVLGKILVALRLTRWETRVPYWACAA